MCATKTVHLIETLPRSRAKLVPGILWKQALRPHPCPDFSYVQNMKRIGQPPGNPPSGLPQPAMSESGKLLGEGRGKPGSVPRVAVPSSPDHCGQHTSSMAGATHFPEKDLEECWPISCDGGL